MHEKLGGELITSPYDLFSVETLRDMHGLRTGTPIPCDAFVFGKGESPRPDGTKVGGKPYWPANRPWPSNREGLPCLFLAQFNFADSRDLFPNLPGDVLLLLAEDAESYLWEPEGLRFEWLPLGLHTASQFDESLSLVKAGPFFGAIFRSADYPEDSRGERHPCRRPVDPDYDLKVPQFWVLPILTGTKIGGVPHFIQSGDDFEGEFLCQFGSIQAAPHVPYPWVNHPECLGLEFDDRGIYGDANEFVMGDMGTIYVFQRADGTVTSSFECY